MTRQQLESERDILVQEVVSGHYAKYIKSERKFFQRRSTELYLEDVKLQILEALDENRKVSIVQDSGDIDKIHIEIHRR